MDVAAQYALAEVTERLGWIPGVRAVTLGGSLARGWGQPGSDIDLGVYYRADAPPDIWTFKMLAKAVDDSGTDETVTGYGGWGTWVNGGAWLNVKGQRVDLIYRDLDRVTRVLEQCRAGQPERHLHGGHPHGFHSPIYLGEVHYARILYDPTGELRALQEQLAVYPPALKKALIPTFLHEAEFALAISDKSVKRAESSYVAGCFFECVYSLVQVLFALNERYFINEKGAVAETRTFEKSPEAFADEVTDVLGCVGRTIEELGHNHKRLGRLFQEIKLLE